MIPFKQFLSESRIGTEKEYQEFFDEFYGKHLEPDEFKKLRRTAIGTEQTLGLRPVVEVSDSGNVTVKWAETDDDIYLIGILTKTGKLVKEDAPDLNEWIDRLTDKIAEGKSLVTTPNDVSILFVNRIKRKLKERGVEFDFTEVGPQIKYKDHPLFKWKTVVLSLA